MSQDDYAMPNMLQPFSVKKLPLGAMMRCVCSFDANQV